MPNRNHRGPRNEGPMSGRRLGECSDNHDSENVPRLHLNRHDGYRKGRGGRRRDQHDRHRHHN